jgi:hypothetical protein
MNIPGFTAEASLYKTSKHYRLKADRVQTVNGEAITPQQFVSCTTNRSCWGVVLGCRDHCEKFDGSTFSSLWYVCGVCFGLFTEFFEFEW